MCKDEHTSYFILFIHNSQTFPYVYLINMHTDPSIHPTLGFILTRLRLGKLQGQGESKGICNFIFYLSSLFTAKANGQTSRDKIQFWILETNLCPIFVSWLYDRDSVFCSLKFRLEKSALCFPEFPKHFVSISLILLLLMHIWIYNLILYA